MNPLRRLRLGRAHQVGDRRVRPPAKIEMDVVLDPVHIEEQALFRADDAAEIGVEALRHVAGDPRRAMLRAEHDVEE